MGYVIIGVMQSSEKLTRSIQTLSQEEEGLGYKLYTPSQSVSVKDPPTWKPTSADLRESAIQDIIEATWPVAQLRNQIRKLGVRPKGRSRAALSRQMIEVFMDRERLGEAVASLSQEARELYIYTLLRLSLQAFYAGDIPPLHTLAMSPALLQTEIENAGLVLNLEDQRILPSELLSFLPPLYLVSQITQVDADDIQGVRLSNPRRLIGQIQQFLNLVQESRCKLEPVLRWAPKGSRYYYMRDLMPVPASARDLLEMPHKQIQIELLAPVPRLNRATLEDWSQTLGLSPFGVEFLYHLLMRIGVLREGSPIALEPELAQHFLTLPAGEQIVVLFRFFGELTDWAAFWHVWRAGTIEAHWLHRPTYWGTFSYEAMLAQMVQAMRLAMLNILAILPHDVWLSGPQIAHMFSQLLPDNTSFKVAANLLTFSHELTGWEGMLQFYLEAMLEGPLHWLGLVDIAHQGGALEVFRLHHLQDLVWKRKETFPLSEVQVEAQEAVRFLADTGELFLEPPVPVAFLQHVETWAKPAGITEKAICYQQSLEDLHRAFEAGQNPETLRKAWEDGVGQAPPKGLLEWWAHWWERYGQVRLYAHQTLIKTRDEFALQELQVAIPEMQDALLGFLTSRDVLVREGEVAELLDKMKAKGYMPKDVD